MKVLVTGNSGMIGHKVVELLDGTCELFTADKKTGQDLTDFSLCKELTKGMDYLYHIAGVKGSGKMTKERPADFFVPILQMNTNILESARLNGVKKILYVSSTAVNHDEFPGWAKETGEKQLEAYNLQYGFENWVILRPNSVYGEYDNFDPDDGMFIPSLMSKIKRGDNPVVVYGDGKDVRDFIYSGDVAWGLIAAMDSLKGTHEIGGNACTIRHVVNTMRQIVDFNVKYAGNSKRTVRLANHPIHIKDKTPLQRGLEKTWNWYKQI